MNFWTIALFGYLFFGKRLGMPVPIDLGSLWNEVQVAASHVVSVANTGLNTIGLPPLPDVSPPISTSSTTTEGVQTLRHVEPPLQPFTPNERSARIAATLAGPLNDALIANPDGPRYFELNPRLVQLIGAFQQAAGFTPDGKYGPATAGALFFFLGSPPPAPLWWVGERAIYQYAPIDGPEAAAQQEIDPNVQAAMPPPGAPELPMPTGFEG